MVMTRWTHLSVPKRHILGTTSPASPQKRSWRSKLLLLILTVVCLTSLGLLLLPYLPHLAFLFHRPTIDASPYKTAAATTREAGANPSASAQGNRLVLPQIGINAEIIEGKNIYVIGKNQGVWHETSNVNPTVPGNMVIAGHRFLYTASNGGYFYNLPELKIGEKIYLRWNGGTYEYEIYNQRTVLPSQVDIRNPDPQVSYKLTMYTCYPLGSTSKRFVLEARQLR